MKASLVPTLISPLVGSLRNSMILTPDGVIENCRCAVEKRATTRVVRPLSGGGARRAHHCPRNYGLRGVEPLRCLSHAAPPEPRPAAEPSSDSLGKVHCRCHPENLRRFHPQNDMTT